MQWLGPHPSTCLRAVAWERHVYDQVRGGEVKMMRAERSCESHNSVVITALDRLLLVLSAYTYLGKKARPTVQVLHLSPPTKHTAVPSQHPLIPRLHRPQPPNHHGVEKTTGNCMVQLPDATHTYTHTRLPPLSNPRVYCNLPKNK